MNIQVNYVDSQGHFDEADGLYQIYLQRYPDDWTVLGTMRGFCAPTGHADEAIDRYKEMLRVVPNDARTEVELATAYKTLGRFQEAIDAYTQAFQIDPPLSPPATLAASTAWR